MNTYKPRADGNPDKIVANLPVIKPDLHKVWRFVRRAKEGAPDEIWLTINFHDFASNPATGEPLYNLCAQVILPQANALVLAQALMVNGMFKEALGAELSARFTTEIFDAALALGKKLDVLLDEFKKRDDEEHAREMAAGGAEGEECGQAKDQGGAL